ncbi:MAG: phenol hydroxylase, partial [Acinetobacter sp.]
DSFMSELVYTQFDQWLAQHEARDLAMLMEFMQEALSDLRKWSDSVFKTAAAESEHNKQLLSQWLAEYLPEVKAAFAQWAAQALSAEAVDVAEQKLLERSKKLGIQLEQVAQA